MLTIVPRVVMTVMSPNTRGKSRPEAGAQRTLEGVIRLSLMIFGRPLLQPSQKAFQGGQCHGLYQRWRMPHVGDCHQLPPWQDLHHAPGLRLQEDVTVYPPYH
jgi:hypothetical protein